MRNFASFMLRLGGFVAGCGLFIAAMAWTVLQVGMFFMEPWEADRYFQWLTPVLATGGALMGIGLQGVAIGLIIRCAAGAFRYFIQMFSRTPKPPIDNEPSTFIVELSGNPGRYVVNIAGDFLEKAGWRSLAGTLPMSLLDLPPGVRRLNPKAAWAIIPA